MHQVVAITTPVSPTEPPLSYGELSPEGKEVFDEARKRDGTLFIYDESEKPPEFSYSDGRTSRIVTRDGERYRVYTSTNAGCAFPTGTES
ncbi:hypothetical protein [Halococcus agarilyticus]|uniref:hypothetical protein n=1 Tax=Halococcus agarilyticus TaxID=1232219 RepID=UPI0006777B4C|nr:hypothetical protein [Halococcus agarilyticus]